MISHTFEGYLLQNSVLLVDIQLLLRVVHCNLPPALFLRLIIFNQPESHRNKPGMRTFSGIRPVSMTLYENRTYVTADGVCSVPSRFLPSLHAMLLVQSASRGVSIKGTQSLIQHK